MKNMPEEHQKNLFTIGYEGLNISDFILKLRKNRIKMVIDIRQTPISRKAFFSKTALATELEKSGIAYLHLKDLGTPKPLRDSLKKTGDYIAFFRDYRRFLSEKTSIIKKLHSLVLESTVALMCFEKEQNKCHRSEVARKLKEFDGNGLQVLPL